MQTPAVLTQTINSIRSHRHAALVVNQLAILVVMFVIGFGGSAAMAALHLEQPEQTSPARTVTEPEPGSQPVQTAPQAALPIPAPVAVAPAERPAAKVAAKTRQSSATVAAAASQAIQTPVTAAVKCSRLDDPKIDWLLQQVAKTKAEHPDIAVGASTVEQALLGARGKNLCAADAQALVAQLCTDPEVVKALNRMVAGLPFFIRPSVGDPCKANLVDVMNKMGQYVPGLSSEPS
jgi:hypothetical protein